MTELTVSIEDVSMLEQIKQAISMLRGVSSVTLKRRRKTSMDRATLQEARPADAGTVGRRGQVAAWRETRREVSGSPTAWQPQRAVGMPYSARLAPCLGAERN